MRVTPALAHTRRLFDTPPTPPIPGQLDLKEHPMPKLTYPKAKRALTALSALYDCGEDLTTQEREDLEMAANTVRAICDRIPDDTP